MAGGAEAEASAELQARFEAAQGDPGFIAFAVAMYEKAGGGGAKQG